MSLAMLKTQIMTMFMMRQGAGASGDIFSLLYGMLLMNIVEYALGSAPAIGLFVQTWLMKRVTPMKQTIGLLTDIRKEKTELNSISMTRIFSGKEEGKKNERADNIFVEKVDAVLDYICSLDNARHIRLDTRYSLNNMDEVDLTPMLKAKVKQMANGEDEQIVELIVFSSALKVSDIRKWIDEIHENYMAEKNNKLGSKIYYFNEMPVEPIMQQEMMPDGTQRKTYRWENMPKMLTFHMNEFKTSKSFTNVYGHHVDELKERLDLFIHHPNWYMDRGIPHSLGIMLHGVPGAGKTSTIKAIAKDTNRHIFNLSLRPYTTQRQLTNLFFNETVVIMGYDGNKQTYKIPLNRRVYVIEDIDCLTDVVMDRATVKTADADKKEGESVTLSFLLNLLDGVLETPGRILIITSNFPDKLDPAFVRPGRIDVKIEFRNATCEFVLDMINKFYDTTKTMVDIPKELDSVFTPAEVMESLCMHFRNVDAAIGHLVEKIGSKKKAEMERLTGTVIADLEVTSELSTVMTKSEEIVAMPPTLVLSDTNDLFGDKITAGEETVGADTKRVNDLLKQEDGQEALRDFSFGGLQWKCGTCKGGPSQSCPICKPQLDIVQKKVFTSMNSALPMAGIVSDALGGFASAFFEETPFLDSGGWMPGQNPGAMKSDIDLNMLN